MIKRSTGFFKIAFFIFCFFIGMFLILFSLTDIRNYVTTEMCIFAFCISITILPLVLELIVYLFGILTKGIKVESKTETLNYKSMKNSAVPYTLINDNGVEKMMFFCEKGKIALLSANNTKIHWGSEKDEIQMKTKLGECFSIFKSIYGVKYEHVECVVYTTLPEKSENPVEKTETPVILEKEQQNSNTSNEVEAVCENQPKTQETLSTTANIEVNPAFQNDIPLLESVEEFDYSLKDTDALIEETITL